MLSPVESKKERHCECNRKEMDTDLWLSVGEGSGKGRGKGREYRGTKYYRMKQISYKDVLYNTDYSMS